MIAVIAASPSRDLDALLAACRARDVTELWAPWAMPSWAASLPGPLGGFARRRTVAADQRFTPIALLGGALRAWASDRADRRYRADFTARLAIDEWSARLVAQRKPTTVIAPSLAARRTFAAARAIHARTVLALDIPLLRALHDDLDRAESCWPQETFLRRYRAPSSAIARQEAERVLADTILVRGPYARARCIADGIVADRLDELPRAEIAASTPALRPTGRMRLAGVASARGGLPMARAVAAAVGATLVVRIGDATEPSDLATASGIACDDGPVDVLIAPSICEIYCDELRGAARAGVPIVTSPMASLASAPDNAHASFVQHVVDPYSLDDLIGATRAALSGERRCYGDATS